ncbi:MAG TPA: SIS domain-containing protein [Acidiphilium sp.]|uniref:D-sedoheptulose-7-phosphate isomerase n=1 Tax=unclassified Acidiphilium TaxID=2617493 RepID=UPI000BDB6CBB|nr:MULTISPECIES: SIS domain-containing protein [unclassified Acidiphilium]OZB25975.1 MAG: phosphoheptose isomerase [Acidiphilium sp. 34-64-41]HQT90270.1 SIS domain-containing protein [Acidiphilium sp.]
MSGHVDVLRRNLQASVDAKLQFLEMTAQHAAFDAAMRVVIESYRRGGRLYVAGNGGSAADAQHLAAEFVSKLWRDRRPLPAEALTVDSSVLTAIGNDYGFDELFARQIRGKMTSIDVFLAISTSGRSRNLLRGLDTCRELGIASIAFLGRDGGEMRERADHCIIVPGDLSSVIQEVHLVMAHSLCECVENSLFPEFF